MEPELARIHPQPGVGMCREIQCKELALGGGC